MRRVFAIAAILAAAACSFRRPAPQADVDAAVEWAAAQNVPLGKTHSLRLPSRYYSLAVNGWANVAHLKDGRTCVLFVREIGYKDNFAGVFACSAPLRASEIVQSENYAGRRYISLAGYGEFEELYITEQRNDRSYDVYFDLN